MPKYEIVKYFWKVPRPDDDEAEDLIHAAHTTAKTVDPTASQILIRSRIHSSTFRNGHYVQDDPHVTIAVKNPQQVRDRKHRNIHGYTKSKTDPKIVGVAPIDTPKPDSTLDNKGKIVWPSGLEEEERDYRVK
ncbi:MAG: hypothetical protein Q9209_006834 [Squamulea sp. 1 TL-2023]